MFKVRSSLLRFLLTLLGAGLLLTTAALAQQPERDYSLTDETSEMFAKYKEALDAKNYDSALALLDSQLVKVPADSYDAALIYQIKTQTLIQKGDFSKVIEPLEKGLAISESKVPTYYEERATRDLMFFLAQLYLQEAVQSKVPAQAAIFFDKADKTMERYFKINPNPTPDVQLIYAQLLYNKGVLNPERPDLPTIRRALEQIEIGLKLSTRPRDTFYVLKLVCLQQLNRNEEAAEILELLVKDKPDNSTYWQQLAALYLGAGQELRAILSMERAQKRGFMSTPKDNFNLIGIYFNISQYEKAAELLEAGLKSGGVDNDIKNWELLALTYQQLDRPYKGIETLKSAAKAFPTSGQTEFMIAQAYHALEKPAEALPHLQAAVAKGNLEKPHAVFLFLAYISYELKKFDIALDAAKKAAEYPEGAKDAQNMIKAIEEIIKDREAKKNQM